MLRGHERSILGIAECGADRFASVSRDRTLRIWDAASLVCERTVIAHDAAVLAVAGLPGQRLATGSADRDVKIWDVQGHPGHAVATLTGHSGWVWAVAPCGPDALASASEDGTVRLWDTNSVECTNIMAGSSPLRTLAVSSRQGLLATGDADGRVVLWTGLKDRRPVTLAAFRAHRAAVRRVRFFDEETLATAGEDNRIRIWRIPQALVVDEAEHDNFVTDLLPLGDGSCSYDGRIVERARTPIGLATS